MSEVRPPTPLPTHPDATASEQELGAAMDSLLGVEGADAGEGAIDALESVDQLLADVASELAGPDPAAVDGDAPSLLPLATEKSSTEDELASVVPEHVDEQAEAGSPTQVGGVSINPEQPEEVSEFVDPASVLEEMSRECEAAKSAVPAATNTVPAASAVSSVDATEAPPAKREPDAPGAIDRLDEALAAAAEEVLADNHASQSGQGDARGELGQAEASMLVSSAPATATDSPLSSVAAKPANERTPTPSAAKPVEPVAAAATVQMAAAPKRVRIGLGDLVARALAPLAERTMGMKSVVRQTLSWMAVYTMMMAMGVWGYLLLRGADAAHEPTSDPAVLLKPGEHAPAPKAAAHGDGHGGQGEKKASDDHGAPKKSSGHDDGHGNKAAAKPKNDNGHGAKSSEKAKKDDAHGAAKKSDGHGSSKSAKAPDKKKAGADKKTAAKSGGHH